MPPASVRDVSLYPPACMPYGQEAEPEADFWLDYDYEHEHELLIRASLFRLL